MIVPIEAVQSGWVTVTAGVGGKPGTVLMITAVEDEMHPAPFCTVTLYVPGANPVNTPLLLL